MPTEISRGIQQMFIMMTSLSLNTCMQPGTPLINGFVDHALWNRGRNGDTSLTPL